MGRDTIADIITSIRNANMSKNGTVRIVSTNITENIVKIFYERVLLKMFGNIRKVLKISWFQPCAIKELGKEYIKRF